MKHNRGCVCNVCAFHREARAFARFERQEARRRTWRPPLGSIWTGAYAPGVYGVVLHDPSERGRYRLQLFDARGFQGHRTRERLEDVAAALRVEFGPTLRKMPEGLLDRLAATWG